MKEAEIRPRALFDEFLAIAKRDIDIFFSDRRGFVKVGCPACAANRSEESFVKDGFSYQMCADCGSLFVSPRPTQVMIDCFYRDSETSRFWAERFFPETAPARRVQIFRPRAQMLQDLIQRFGVPAPRVLVGVGAGYGIFLEEVRALGIVDETVAIEPSRDLARTCAARGFRTIDKPVEQVGPQECRAAIATSFEMLEHLFAPEDFLRAVRGILMPGGLLVFTTLTVSGWDMQVLWERSKSISPPHHINLLTTEGLARLVERLGFRLEEIATPCRLDVDIVQNTLIDEPSTTLPRFAAYLLRHRDPEEWADFQAFLQRHALSSHVRVTARRPEHA